MVEDSPGDVRLTLLLALGLVFTAAFACESGGVSLFKSDNGTLAKIGDLDVGSNSHTVAVDSITHKAYFPLKNVGGSPMLRIMSPQ